MTPDGGVRDEFDDVDPDPVSDDADGPRRGGGSPGIAVATALVLGVLGPLIALASGVAVFAIDALTGGLSLTANVALTLFFGQYVAFGGLAVGYLAWRGFDREGIVSYLGVRVPSLKEIGIVLGSWVVILILILAVSTIVQLLGTETAANQSAELAMGNPSIIPLLIAASFLVIGPCEEILYRGVVQGRLRESLPAAPSILLSAAIFATIHVMALTGGLSARLTTVSILFVPSLVFGAVYEYTENLVVPALLHGLHNAVLFTALYVTVTRVDPSELPAILGFLPV
ncbi:lysostaphin resistance A-like protein [Halorubrum sp. AS12]|uniref:CPBP family intramembrane glutamic endopeptidase n=1 Tax=Halorubrum sp. AS12 TaxID=3409687 RepID=UPI003DA71983